MYRRRGKKEKWTNEKKRREERKRGRRREREQEEIIGSGRGERERGTKTRGNYREWGGGRVAERERAEGRRRVGGITVTVLALRRWGVRSQCFLSPFFFVANAHSRQRGHGTSDMYDNSRKKSTKEAASSLI